MIIFYIIFLHFRSKILFSNNISLLKKHILYIFVASLTLHYIFQNLMLKYNVINRKEIYYVYFIKLQHKFKYYSS